MRLLSEVWMKTRVCLFVTLENLFIISRQLVLGSFWKQRCLLVTFSFLAKLVSKIFNI